MISFYLFYKYKRNTINSWILEIIRIFENSQNFSHIFFIISISIVQLLNFSFKSYNRHRHIKQRNRSHTGSIIAKRRSRGSFSSFFSFFFFFLRSYGNYACARMAYLIQWNEPLTSLFSHTMTTRSRNTTDHTHTRTHTSVHYTHATRVSIYTTSTRDCTINLILWMANLAISLERRWRNEVIIELSVLNYFEVL